MTLDLRLKLGSVCVIAGPSQCGKTYFTNKLIENYKEIFNPTPRKIFWFYGEIEPTHKLKYVEYSKGLPDNTVEFEKTVIILDDLFLEAGNSDIVTNLFSRVAHHRECFIIFITQNLYHQSKHNRTRMLNAHYLVLFKNIRDKSVINTLARQMYPNNTNFLPDVFIDIMENNSYGYMFLDLRVETPEDLRVRTNIFFDPEFYIYKQNRDRV